MTKYSSKNIKNLQYPESIQHNPTMYIGSVDEYGLFQLLKEVGDNVVDEALEGRASKADIFIDKETYVVCDDGNGIPIAPVKIKEPISGKLISMPAVQAVCSIPHTSGKFDDTAYKVSRGVHGLGIKCTNALSDKFEVITFNEGAWWVIEFKQGRLSKPLSKTKAPVNPVTGKAMVKGTRISYVPTKTIFSTNKVPSAHLLSWAEIAAYFTPKLKVTLASAKSKKEFYFANGTLDYIEARLAKLKAKSLGVPFTYTTALCDITMSFTDCSTPDLRAFTNGSPNASGGEHLNSTIKALHSVLTKYVKNKKQIFTAADIKDGLVGLVNAKLSGPEFSSQTKERLTDARVKAPLVDALTEALTKFFNANKALATQLIDRATKLNELKNRFAKSKKLVSALGALKRKGMPIKYLSPNKSTKVAEREIFLVEGESAGGPGKEARFPYQGVLPLKGKVMNVCRAKGDKGLESEEIIHILGAIGFDAKATDPYDKLQAGKIICLADPDPDGKHINSLLLALFYKYLPELFARGMIYIVKAPEFYSIHKGTLYTSDGAQELRSKLNKAGVPASAEINHIKGWGEISATLMRILAMDPQTRTLIQIKPLEDSDDEFYKLMADDPETRRKLLGLEQ